MYRIVKHRGDSYTPYAMFTIFYVDADGKSKGKQLRESQVEAFLKEQGGDPGSEFGQPGHWKRLKGGMTLKYDSKKPIGASSVDDPQFLIECMDASDARAVARLINDRARGPDYAKAKGRYVGVKMGSGLSMSTVISIARRVDRGAVLESDTRRWVQASTIRCANMTIQNHPNIDRMVDLLLDEGKSRPQALSSAGARKFKQLLLGISKDPGVQRVATTIAVEDARRLAEEEAYGASTRRSVRASNQYAYVIQFLDFADARRGRQALEDASREPGLVDVNGALVGVTPTAGIGQSKALQIARRIDRGAQIIRGRYSLS